MADSKPTTTSPAEPAAPGLSRLPWMKPVEFPILTSPMADESRAAGGEVRDVLGPLAAALEQVRVLYREAMTDGADQRVSMSDLAVVVEQANLLERAASALTIAATAGYARREQHDWADDLGQSVESLRARGFVHEWCAQELGHLVRISSRTADTRVTFAADVASVMPYTLTAVSAGAIEAWQAQNILALLREAEADDETIREIDLYLAPRLAGSDPGRLLSLTRYALGRVRPDLLPDRAQKSCERRALEKWEIEPGLTEFTARMPSEKAAAIWAAATTLAKDYIREDPALTLDQARLDAFVDLALANVTVKTTVTLGVPVVTSAYARTGDAPVELRDPEAPPPGDAEGACPDNAMTRTTSGRGDLDTGYSGPGALPRRVPDWAAHPDSTSDSFTAPPGCQPGEREWWLSGVHLPGIGYVPPDVVQSLITKLGTTISSALLDSSTGMLLSYIHEGYRPPRAMQQMVRLRDGVCRFFGCNLPARRCDQDHAEAWQCDATHVGEGATCGENLAGLCRRHHRTKQHRQWTYHLDPDTAVSWWINSVTGVWRTTIPEVSIGCKDPPFSTPRHRPRLEHLDDRELVNVILGNTEVTLSCDSVRVFRRAQPKCDAATSTVDGTSTVVPAVPTSPGDCLSPTTTLASARKRIPEATDIPPF